MTKVSTEVRGFLQQVEADLTTPISGPDAAAIRKAIAALPSDATLTLGQLEQLGLEGPMRANLVFALLVERHPEIKNMLRSADSLAGVFAKLEGQASFDIGPALKAFSSALLNKDPLNVDTGDEAGDFDLDDSVLARVEVDEVDLGGADDETLQLRRVEDEGIRSWTAEWKSEGKTFPLSAFDLRSLEGLRTVIVQWTAVAAEDPLLAFARQDLDGRQGGTLEGLLQEVDTTIAQKTAAREAHLAEVDAALRGALKERVGRAPKEQIDALAEKALQAGEG